MTMRSDVFSSLFVFSALLFGALAFPLPPTNPTTQFPPNATKFPKGFVSEHDASELNLVHNTPFFVHVPLGYGFVEDTSKTSELCYAFDLLFTAEQHKIEEVVRSKCKVPNRFKRMFESMASWGPFAASSDIAVQESTKIAAKLIAKLQKGLYERIEAIEWKKFIDDVFVNKAVRNTLEYFKIDAAELMEPFGIDAQFALDKQIGFWQEIVCDHDGNIILTICGPKNPTRKYGIIHEVIPLGSFSTNGTVYRFPNTPKHAIEAQNHFHSAGSCKRLGDHYACSQNENRQCTINNFVHCPLVTVATPETVYVKEVSDLTFIATDPKKHPKYKLGNEKRSVPSDGAFLISFSRNTTLKIASIEIRGRHGAHVVHDVPILQSYNDVTHDELYAAVQNGHMSEAEANLIHGTMAAQYGTFSGNNALYYLSWLKYIIPDWVWQVLCFCVAVMILLATVFLLYTCIVQRAFCTCSKGISDILKCFCCCVSCCSKPSKEQLHK